MGVSEIFGFDTNNLLNWGGWAVEGEIRKEQKQIQFQFRLTSHDIRMNEELFV